MENSLILARPRAAFGVRLHTCRRLFWGWKFVPAVTTCYYDFAPRTVIRATVFSKWGFCAEEFSRSNTRWYLKSFESSDNARGKERKRNVGGNNFHFIAIPDEYCKLGKSLTPCTSPFRHWSNRECRRVKVPLSKSYLTSSISIFISITIRHKNLVPCPLPRRTVRLIAWHLNPFLVSTGNIFPSRDTVLLYGEYSQQWSRTIMNDPPARSSRNRFPANVKVSEDWAPLIPRSFERTKNNVSGNNEKPLLRERFPRGIATAPRAASSPPSEIVLRSGLRKPHDSAPQRRQQTQSSSAFQQFSRTNCFLRDRSR